MSKILLLDIETAPTLAYVWKLFKENIGVDQIVEPTRIICWSAKWYKKKGVEFGSEWDDGDKMLVRLHGLLSSADAVVTYNGNRFDLPKIAGEFLRRGFAPVPPIPSIDLYTTVRKLGFQSGKLAFVAPHLSIGEKVKHEGFRLWSGVLSGDVKARARMERYNRQDTVLLQQLYTVLRPYIKNHPYLDAVPRTGCSTCGGVHLQKRGTRRTKAYSIERLQCQGCGAWNDGARVSVGSLGVKKKVKKK